MAKAGNWNRNAWNKGTPRRPSKNLGISPLMQRIIDTRIANKCTQTWLAEKTGWSVTAIQQYETGERRASLAYVEAAAQVFGMRLALIHLPEPV